MKKLTLFLTLFISIALFSTEENNKSDELKLIHEMEVEELRESEKDCKCKDIPLKGKVKVVTSFPDLKVKVVDSFADIHVKPVTGFPDKCGEWQFVESFPDFTIMFVDAFPDIKTKFVESFPGMK